MEGHEYGQVQVGGIKDIVVPVIPSSGALGSGFERLLITGDHDQCRGEVSVEAGVDFNLLQTRPVVDEAKVDGGVDGRRWAGEKNDRCGERRQLGCRGNMYMVRVGNATLE
jgi:hypothetical protein